MEPRPGGLGAESGHDAAARVVAVVLGGHRAEAAGRAAGVVAGDAEDLHQFRIALRRARSVVQDAGRVLPRDRRRRAAAALKSMADLTSRVRDLDVVVADLPDICDRTDSRGARSDRAGARSTAEACDVLTAEARALREEPARRLAEALRGPELAELMAAWGDVSDPYWIGGDPPGVHAGRPAVEVTNRWIRKSFRDARRAGRAAARSDDLEHWHDLRKALKKLRYEIEAFEAFHPRSTVKPVRRHLRRLQVVIGGLQDLRVRGEVIDQLVERSEADGYDAAGEAARCIRDSLDDELVEVQHRCLEAWRAFDSPETKHALKALTEP